MSDSILPLIMCGGAGTRLWPVSRESYPKQLWPLLSERSLIQETALRATGPGFAPQIVVCNQEHRFLIAEQLRGAGITGGRIVLEPVGRNSAPAIAAAALLNKWTAPSGSTRSAMSTISHTGRGLARSNRSATQPQKK